MGSAATPETPVTITGQSIKSMKVTGDLDHATIQLSQAIDPKNPALGTLAVTGTMNDSSITAAGNVGTVTLGAMNGSQLLVGTMNGVAGLAADSTAFVTPVPAKPNLTSLTIKGLVSNQASFTASAVDAWNIGKVSLKLVDSAVEDNPFGFAAAEIGSMSFTATGVNSGKPVTLKTLDAPEDLLNPKNNPAAVAFPLASGFTLRLVESA